MKTLHQITLAIVLIVLIASCQSKVNVKQTLSNQDTRKEIMDTIASHSDMSKEMMVALMNGKNGKTVMMENHQAMMKMMKDDPGMMKSMMSDMMENCKNDTAMMSSMCASMMESPEMMKMMKKMKMENKDKGKMKGKKDMNKKKGKSKKIK